MRNLKWFLLIVKIFVLDHSVSAQMLIAPVGGYGTTSKGSLSWSIGEVAVQPILSARNKLAQGLQQPSLEATEVKDEDLIISNGLTPNGDNINDELIIEGLDQNSKDILTIYNRGGKEVYNATGIEINNRPFRGFDKNDKPLPPGPYYYRLTFGSSGKKPQLGTINIIY